MMFVLSSTSGREFIMLPVDLVRIFPDVAVKTGMLSGWVRRDRATLPGRSCGSGSTESSGSGAFLETESIP